MSFPPSGQPPQDPFGNAPGWTSGPAGPPPPVYSQQGPQAPWPPQQQPWPAQPNRGGSQTHWWIGGAVLGVVALVAVVVLATTGGNHSKPAVPPTASSVSAAPAVPNTSAPRTPQKPSAATSDLNSLLLKADDITSRMKTTMTSSASESGSAPLNITVTPPNCTSAYAPATASAYQGSGFTSMAVQGFRGPGNSAATSVIEAVAKFPDAAAAQAFIRAQYSSWSSCKYTSVTASYGDGASDQVKIAVPGDGSTINDNAFAPGSTGGGCERAMTAQAAIVIDARVCRGADGNGNAGGYAMSVVHTIQRNIT